MGSKRKTSISTEQNDLGKYIIMSRISPLQKQRKVKGKTTINLNRKGSIVKERCRQLTEIALGLYPKHIINNEDLAYLVTSYIGGDRGTVRAYMGYQGYVKHSKTGCLSRIIGRPRKGYLEKFGFMHRKGVFWIIHTQSELFPSKPPLSLNNECVDKTPSNEKISLSHSQQQLGKEERQRMGD